MLDNIILNMPKIIFLSEKKEIEEELKYFFSSKNILFDLGYLLKDSLNLNCKDEVIIYNFLIERNTVYLNYTINRKANEKNLITLKYNDLYNEMRIQTNKLYKIYEFKYDYNLDNERQKISETNLSEIVFISKSRICYVFPLKSYYRFKIVGPNFETIIKVNKTKKINIKREKELFEYISNLPELINSEEIYNRISKIIKQEHFTDVYIEQKQKSTNYYPREKISDIRFHDLNFEPKRINGEKPEGKVIKFNNSK